MGGFHRIIVQLAGDWDNERQLFRRADDRRIEVAVDDRNAATFAHRDRLRHRCDMRQRIGMPSSKIEFHSGLRKQFRGGAWRGDVRQHRNTACSIGNPSLVSIGKIAARVSTAATASFQFARMMLSADFFFSAPSAMALHIRITEGPCSRASALRSARSGIP